jgi:hypothetical protein
MKNQKTIIASILAATLCTVSPLLASASDHGGGSSSSDHSSGSSSGGGSDRSAPAPASADRSAPAPASVDRSGPAPVPVDRSAPAPAPVERSAPAPVERSAPAPVQGGGTQPLPRPPQHGPVQPLPHYQARTPVRTASNGNGQPAPSPQQDSSQWDWDSGAPWVGTITYWGDGFWGPLVAGLASSAYIVAQGSPGAQLLQEYGLTQTPCGPPNLVEILGPGASEICTFPNDHVAPGVYRIDPETLTLISSPQ